MIADCDSAHALSEVEAARARNDKAAMATWAETATGCDFEDPLDFVRIGIHLRDVELFDPATRMFDFVLKRDPGHGAACYELAWLHMLHGRHVEAFLALEPGLERNLSDARALSLAIRLLFGMGSKTYTQAMIGQLKHVQPNHPALAWHEAFNDYVSTFSEKIAVMACLKVERLPAYLKEPAVATRIEEALRVRAGFSLIRLGDGEGAFLRLSDADERSYCGLYRYNRLDRSHVWFNGTIDIYASGFAETAFGLDKVIENADVAGLPYKTWIEHEYRIVSPTGISSLVNVFRLLATFSPNPARFYTAQRIHIELARSGALKRIIQSQKDIGLIACHPALPAFIRDTYGVEVSDFHRIPGEKLFETIIGGEAAAGIHYPDRFNAIMDSLGRADLSGKLYLVAGGILGKFYCDRIKKSGGVAVDVGSLVDAWIGANTRPGYESLKGTI
ncbi:hypothetical protein [Asticcacaulis sp. AC402]|uniref:hypothetical protein n=1 Tax=Asticcacaulis sp. AC402 TaxID=1282361 RepID=UPI0003C3FB3C|nr:hypothetical protein [Asticcacaulis sp. AC402]ESQ73900.1 hypothetical protein ABAC402_16765 [Asticcacaulis sp. AC402]